MLKLIPADQLSRSLFAGLMWLSVALAVVGLIVSETRDLALVCAGINLVCAAAYRAPRLQQLPGALIFGVLTMAYFQFPLWFLSFRGGQYDYGLAFDVPALNSEYVSALGPAAVFFLVTMAVCTWGMVAAGGHDTPGRSRPLRLSHRGLIVLLAVGAYVAWVQMGDIRSIFTARAEEAAKAESFIALLFNDKAYQLVFPVLFYLFPVDFRRPLVKAAFVFGLTLFLALNVYSTSKGALLTIAISFFLYPVAVFSRRSTPVYWPSRTIIVAVILMVVPLYFVAMVSRHLQSTGEPMSIESTRAALEQVQSTVAADGESALDPIAIRLSANLTNLVTIYQEFGWGRPTDHREGFRAYVSDSFLNLVLPGTPYPDAYVPSSQLLPDVLMRAKLESRLDRISFLTAANTQPYTLPGFGVVAFGIPATLAFMFMVGWAYVTAYRLAPGVISKLVVMFSLMTMLMCYGFETALQYTIMTAVTSGFLVMLVVVAGWRRHAGELSH